MTTVVLCFALGICAVGWLGCSIAAEAMATWIKRKGLQPTEDEARILVREVVDRRFRIKKS